MIDSIPSDLTKIFENFIVTEYAYFTRKGEPLCWPVTPYWDGHRNIISISTGVAYPNKADHAKRNPKVALLFSDAKSSGLRQGPPVLVQGDATVLDQDIQQNTDRYVLEMRRKFPQARMALNGLTVKMLDFYLPRLWVEIKPYRIVTGIAREASVGVGREASVLGPPLPPATPQGVEHFDPLPHDQMDALFRVAAAEDTGVLTMRGGDGYPQMQRIHTKPGGNRLELESASSSGPAALTFHHHSLAGTRFTAYMARGGVLEESGRYYFTPRKLVGFFGNGFVFPLSVIPSVIHLRKRLHRELEKRNQLMPKLRVPRGAEPALDSRR